MKKTISLLLAMVLLLTAIPMVFTSCSEKDDDPGADIHLFLSGRLYDLDPTMAIVDDDAAQVLSLLYEPLFKLKANGKVDYALAKSYKIDKTDREMTINLRKTYWSDSKLVTADDVLFAWQRILDPAFENPAAALLYDIENALYVKQGAFENGVTATVSDLGVEAVDDNTLVIHFRKDLEYIDYEEFLRNLTSVALSPIPEDTVSNASSSDNWSKRVATIVTNGPFTLSALAYQSGEFSLQRNQYYRRGKNSDSSISKYVTPQFLTTTWQTTDMSYEEYEKFLTEKVVIHFADDQTQNLKDDFYFIGELPIAVRKSDKYAAKIIANDLLSVSTLVLNMTESGNPALQNAKIRQALSYAIDRAALANDLVYAKPATGFVTPGVREPGKNADFRTDANALIATGAKATEAQTLVEEGLKELAALGYDEAQLKEIRLLYSGESINDGYTAKVLKEAWEALGFTVVLDAAYGQQRTVGNEILVLDSVMQMNFNSSWKDCRVDEDMLEQPDEEEGDAALEGDDALLDEEEQEEEVFVDTTADVMLVDYQMLATNALATLAGFAVATSGNGFDMTDKSEDSIKEYSYQMTPHVSGYNSDAYNTLIADAYSAADAEARAKALHDAEEVLLKDLPIIPLVFNQDYYLLSDTVTKITTNEYGMPVFSKAYQKGYKDLLLYAEEGEEE